MITVSFTVDGRSYPFVPTSRLTLAECRELKRLSGMTPVAAEKAMAELDPDAWGAALLISMRRVDPSVKDTDLDDIEPVEMIMALTTALEEATADAVPPSSNGVAKPRRSRSVTTPEASGT